MKCKFCGQNTKTTVCSYCGYDNIYGYAFEDISTSNHKQTQQGPYAYDTKPQQEQPKGSYEPNPYEYAKSIPRQQTTTSQQKNYFNWPLCIIFFILNPSLGFLYFVITKVILPQNQK